MKINGDIVTLKLVTIKDAKFILKLRQNESLNKYISLTSIKLDEQKIWIKNYLKRQDEKKEFYFIIQNKKDKSCGTVRIYEIDEIKKECVWGSFILDNTRPDGASYEVIKLSLDFAFKVLKMKKILLDVHRENNKAIHIYEKSGFKKYNEDNINCYYEKVKG